MSDIAIRTEALGKRYRLGGPRVRYRTLRESVADTFRSPLRRLRRSGASAPDMWALRHVSLEVKQGDVVGVIGRNGAGKSTLLKILSRVTEPSEGYAETRGRVGSLLEVGTGFHNELSGRENIYLNGAILGMRNAEIRRKFDEIVAFAEVETFVDTPVKHYSSGMYLRLAFAVAAHMEPDILLVDEVLAVGDAMFQKKCLGKMDGVAREGRTVLFVSHNMAAVRALCRTAIVLDQGAAVSVADVGTGIETYYKAIGALRAAPTDDVHAPHPHGGFGRITVNGGGDNTIGQSDSFEVATTFQIDQEVSGFHIYCMLDDMHGRHIFVLREDSSALGFPKLGPGKYGVSVAFPALWLSPGLYSVFFKLLVQGTYGATRRESDRFPLDVSGSNSVVEAVLHPAVTWGVTGP